MLAAAVLMRVHQLSEREGLLAQGERGLLQHMVAVAEVGSDCMSGVKMSAKNARRLRRAKEEDARRSIAAVFSFFFCLLLHAATRFRSRNCLRLSDSSSSSSAGPSFFSSPSPAPSFVGDAFLRPPLRLGVGAGVPSSEGAPSSDANDTAGALPFLLCPRVTTGGAPQATRRQPRS